MSAPSLFEEQPPLLALKYNIYHGEVDTPEGDPLYNPSRLGKGLTSNPVGMEGCVPGLQDIA